MTGLPAPGVRVVTDLAQPPRFARVPLEGVDSIAALIERAAERWPDRVAWRFDPCGQALTFAEIERRTARIAAALGADGVAAGDRVALMAPNSPAFPLSWLALSRLGAATVPVNVRYRRRDLAHVLREADPALLLAAPEALETARAAAKLAGSAVRIVDVDTYLAAAESRAGSRAAARDTAPRPGPDTIANIQFTSGTTGAPKGCVLSHRYWLAFAWTLTQEAPQIAADDVLFTAQPMSYIDPQWNVIVALAAGAELVVADGFHPSTFWDRVRRYGVTYFYCLGLMPALLHRMPPSPRDREHRVRLIQASAIPAALHRTLEERWGVPWLEAFGMTETGSDLFMQETEAARFVGSSWIGVPRAHREAAVVTRTGSVAAPGEPGELWIRGDGLFLGYLGQEDRAAEPDAWFRTGDIVQHDGAGRIAYVGRTKDMIRRAGENVSAAEVESVVTAHPAVQVSAVIAVPDELRGEEVACFVLREPGDPRDDATLFSDLAEFCAAELASFKIPRYWRSVTKFPRTVSERVAKHRLPDPLDRSSFWDLRSER
ncbi:Long-chain-fatty-acid--CoA ligase [Leucobacter sp. 7(1)]|uniref:AMP-binding protein n=1 Tax=Leucobacter sp. 7(1) TaxID=1255613 RepID=UPI00097F3EBA|nr:AMP-binding protein [Leucobacter sp. 7(1)]SJN11096.1 Long-chain-fatty-acid--CoA ligase [Leucobacter sp. 7(1)]